MTKRTPHTQPQTVAEAVALLLAELKAEDKAHIRAMKKDDLIDLHFSLGMYIRNHLGLWQGNEALLADCGRIHPDDASGVILEALWAELQRSPQPAPPPAGSSFAA